MKILAVSVALTFCSIVGVQAAITTTVGELEDAYGKINKYRPVVLVPDGTTWTQEDTTIRVRASGGSITSIEYTRQTPFNELEIPNLLKPLSPTEWKQSGNDWKSGSMTAHWDGGGRITVQ